MWIATLASKYWKHALALIAGVVFLLVAWGVGDRIYNRYFGTADKVQDVTESFGAGPIFELPGPSSVAFRDSSGNVEMEEAQDLGFEPEVGVEVERGEGDDIRLVAGVQRIWLPDITGQSAVKIKSLNGGEELVRSTPQSTPIVSLGHQFSVGPSLTQSVDDTSPGVMLNYSPIQIWAFRFGVFGAVSKGEGNIPIRLGGGPSTSIRLTRTIRPVIGYDAAQKGVTIGLTVDL